MSVNQERDLFQPYVEKRYRQAGAMTFGQKVKVIEQLEEETKEGKIPVGGDQVIKLNPSSTAVKAVREGKTIALDGKKKISTTGSGGSGNPDNNAARKRALIAAPLLILIPLILCAVWWFLPSGELSAEDAQATAVALGTITATATISPTVTPTVIAPVTEITAVPTMTPLPTFTPVPVESAAYEVDVTEDNPLANYINPVSLLFAGVEYQVKTAELNPEWAPDGVEWWPGTDVRRVFAVPYQESVLAEAFAHLGKTITVRLRTGAAIHYRLDDVEKAHTLQIEKLTSDSPSIALILYGPEESDERWFITGSAVQIGDGAAVPETETVTSQTLATIQGCQQNEMMLSCTIQLTAEHYLTDLRLTDVEWIEAAAFLPTAEITPVDENLTVQIAGHVRSPHTAVLLWRNGDETVMQMIPSPQIQTTEQPEE